jgi:hypothetical protein
VKAKVTYDQESEIRRLEAELSDIKKKMVDLRHSRRVLMDVVVIREQRYRLMMQQLESSRRRRRRRTRAPNEESPEGLN